MHAPTERVHRGAGVISLAVAAAVAGSWILALVLNRVPVGLAGDESGRLLISFDASSFSGFFGTLFSGSAWTDIHPPGDALSKGLVNILLGPFVQDVGTLVRVHQMLAALSVIGGLVAIALGIRARWGSHPAIAFVVLAAAASPVTYVAQHLIAEAPTLLIVGLATRHVLCSTEYSLRRSAPAALLLFLAAVTRPEAAAVFSSIAILPLLQRAWASVVLLVGSAGAPVVITTAVIEVTGAGESYASIRRFTPESFFSVVTDEQMRSIIWGLGISAFVSIAIAALLLVRVGIWKRSNRSWEALALSLLWLFWAVVFTWQVAVGAVHRQERAYIFVALLGILALAALIGELETANVTVPTSIVLVAGSVFALFAVSTTWSETHREWQDLYPPQSEELADFFVANSAPDDSVLFGWMWWEEWRVGLHATDSSAPDSYCLYYRCRAGESRSAANLIDVSGLDDLTARRRVEAASFLSEVRPRHIVIFTEERQEAWDNWPGSQPSFVRPLLEADGNCWNTVVNDDRYCSVLANDHYRVLELQGA